MRNILEVKNLVRSYNTATFKDSKNNVNVLKGISFQVAEGEFVGIMGKSGCGKTTLLKTLGMIDKPTDGTIKFMGEGLLSDGQPLSGRKYHAADDHKQTEY